MQIITSNFFPICIYLQISAKGKITTSGTYIPPKSQTESTNQQQARQQVSTAGIYVPPETTGAKGCYQCTWSLNYKPLFCIGQRKRKLDAESADGGDAPPTKVPRPSSPMSFGPGEIFFRVDDKTKYVVQVMCYLCYPFIFFQKHADISIVHNIPLPQYFCQLRVF